MTKKAIYIQPKIHMPSAAGHLGRQLFLKPKLFYKIRKLVYRHANMSLVMGRRCFIVRRSVRAQNAVPNQRTVHREPQIYLYTL